MTYSCVRTFSPEQRSAALATCNKANHIRNVPRTPRETDGSRLNVLRAARVDTQREIDDARATRTKILAEARSLSTEIRSLTRIQQAAQ